MSTRGGSNDATLPLISTEPATTLNGAAPGTGEVVQRASIAERTAANTFADVSVTAPLHVVQTGTPALPTGASTEATLAAQSAKLPASLGQKASAASMAVVVASDQSAVPVSGTFYQATQPVSNASLPLPTGAATSANQASDQTLAGAVTETAPATDTASSGLNGRLQRVAQRLTSMIAQLPAALGAGGGLKVDGSGTALPVSGTVTANAGTGTLAVSAAALPLPTGASTEATLAAASAKLPATLGQKAMAASMAVVVASDQSTLPVGSRQAEIAVTPTLDTAVYASGDSLHTTVLTFANAVAVSGGSGYIEKLVVVDKDVQSAAGELWLFNATVTPATANAAHSISDADAALAVGIIPWGPFYASALNSVSVAKSVNLAFKCAGTSLFGILVTRGTPTYTASGLVVTLQISQN